MAKTRIKLTIQAPKIRKPVAKKANSVMKSKKDYKRKDRYGRKTHPGSEEK